MLRKAVPRRATLALPDKNGRKRAVTGRVADCASRPPGPRRLRRIRLHPVNSFRGRRRRGGRSRRRRRPRGRRRRRGARRKLRVRCWRRRRDGRRTRRFRRCCGRWRRPRGRYRRRNGRRCWRRRRGILGFRDRRQRGLGRCGDGRLRRCQGGAARTEETTGRRTAVRAARAEARARTTGEWRRKCWTDSRSSSHA